MCGVLGMMNLGGIDMVAFRRLLLQSMIRGKHATGIAWNENGEIKSKIVAQSADLFEMPHIKTDLIIGHTRYSTSGFEYNQPIVGKTQAISHNGVITQEPSDQWEGLFGFATEGECDSELILRSIEQGKHPVDHFRTSSMAVVMIDIDQAYGIHAFRNELRPLYQYDGEYGVAFASTKDIFHRADFSDGTISRLEPCVHYSHVLDSEALYEIERQTRGDRQP